MTASMLIWISLAGIIIFGLILATSEENSKKSNVSTIMLCLFFISFIVFSLGGIFYSTYAEESLTHIEKTSKTSICSLSNQTNTEGTIKGGIFCINGSSNGVDYYYMMKEEFNGYKKIKVPCDQSLIIESEDCPHLDCYNKKLNDDINMFWFCGDKSQCEKVVQYKIYIPKNSINYEFKPD